MAHLKSEFTDTSNMDSAEKSKLIKSLTNDIGYDQATTGAKKCIDKIIKFDDSIAIRLLEEIKGRDADLNEFYTAAIYGNTENLSATLHYLDYLKTRDQDATPTTFNTPNTLENVQEDIKIFGWDELDDSKLAILLKKLPIQQTQFSTFEALKDKGASVQEFLMASVYSNSDNPESTLHYLDYKREKHRNEHIETLNDIKKLETELRDEFNTFEQYLLNDIVPKNLVSQPYTDLHDAEQAIFSTSQIEISILKTTIEILDNAKHNLENHFNDKADAQAAPPPIIQHLGKIAVEPTDRQKICFSPYDREGYISYAKKILTAFNATLDMLEPELTSPDQLPSNDSVVFLRHTEKTLRNARNTMNLPSKGLRKLIG